MRKLPIAFYFNVQLCFHPILLLETFLYSALPHQPDWSKKRRQFQFFSDEMRANPLYHSLSTHARRMASLGMSSQCKCVYGGGGALCGWGGGEQNDFRCVLINVATAVWLTVLSGIFLLQFWLSQGIIKGHKRPSIFTQLHVCQCPVVPRQLCTHLHLTGSYLLELKSRRLTPSENFIVQFVDHSPTNRMIMIGVRHLIQISIHINHIFNVCCIHNTWVISMT